MSSPSRASPAQGQSPHFTSKFDLQNGKLVVPVDVLLDDIAMAAHLNSSALIHHMRVGGEPPVGVDEERRA